MQAKPDDVLCEQIEKLRLGDRRAERVVVSILEPRLRRLLNRVLRSSGEVDDALQESLWAFFRALPQFRGETTLPNFALGIARLHALTRLRSAHRERVRHSSFCLEYERLVEPPRPPHDELLRGMRGGRLSRLCAHLPPEQAQALLLRFVHDWSVSEIAARTSTPPNTVRTRLRLGRSMLRRLILLEPESSELLA
jgi:RNA polymerase sigma-70 factor (ECF subfamily)